MNNLSWLILSWPISYVPLLFHIIKQQEDIKPVSQAKKKFALYLELPVYRLQDAL